MPVWVAPVELGRIRAYVVQPRPFACRMPVGGLRNLRHPSVIPERPLPVALYGARQVEVGPGEGVGGVLEDASPAADGVQGCGEASVVVADHLPPPLLVYRRELTPGVAGWVRYYGPGAVVEACVFV